MLNQVIHLPGEGINEMNLGFGKLTSATYAPKTVCRKEVRSRGIQVVMLGKHLPNDRPDQSANTAMVLLAEAVIKDQNILTSRS